MLKGKAITLRDEGKQFQTQQIHFPGKKKFWEKRVDLSTEHNLVLNDPIFCFKRKARKLWFTQGWKWSHVCHVCRLKPHENEKIFHKASTKDGHFQEWWLLAERGFQFEEYISHQPNKAMKVHGLKIFGRTYKVRWQTFKTSLPISTSLVFPRLSSVFPNAFVLVPLALWQSLNHCCKLFIKRFHASFVSKITLLPFWCAFPWNPLDHSSNSRRMRSEFWQL